jgi:hypothetical protein
MTRSLPRLFALLVALLAAAIAVGLACGPTFGWNEFVVEFRLPGVVLAAVVGAGLASTGAVLQAMSGTARRPSCSARRAARRSASWRATGSASDRARRSSSSSALSAFAAILAVLRIARIGRRMPVQTLLLAGITVSTLGSAVILLYFTLRPSRATAMLFLMGACRGRWRFIAMTARSSCRASPRPVARALNAFAMGESTAPPRRRRRPHEARVLPAPAAMVARSSLLGPDRIRRPDRPPHGAPWSATTASCCRRARSAARPSSSWPTRWRAPPPRRRPSRSARSRRSAAGPTSCCCCAGAAPHATS